MASSKFHSCFWSYSLATYFCKIYFCVLNSSMYSRVFLILGSSWNLFSSQFQTTSWSHFWFLYTTGFAFLYADCRIMVAFYALIPFLPASEWWLSLVVVAENTVQKSWKWIARYLTEIQFYFISEVQAKLFLRSVSSKKSLPPIP